MFHLVSCIAIGDTEKTRRQKEKTRTSNSLSMHFFVVFLSSW